MHTRQKSVQSECYAVWILVLHQANTHSKRSTEHRVCVCGLQLPNAASDEHI